MSATIPESIRELAAGFALGALTAEETRTLAAAMARSPELADEVAEYREVNALLALAVAERPDPSVRQRLLDHTSAAKVVPMAGRQSRSVPFLAVALAASAMIAVGLGARVLSLNEAVKRDAVSLAAANDRLAQRERTLNTLLMAESDLTVVQLTTAGAQAPGIQFFWNRRSSMGVLHAFRLPPTAAGKVYQLWLIRGGVAIPSATFNSGADGDALVQAFELPAGGGFEAAAITVEPAGGSQKPTLPIFLVGKVSGL